MTTAILTAITSSDWEARLVGSLERVGSGLRIARRCVDLADLLAAASAGHGAAAIVSADLRGLDRDALGQLLQAGVAPVGLVAPDDEAGERRLRQLGIDRVVSATALPSDIAEAVDGAIAAADAPLPHLTRTSLLPNLAAVDDADPNDPGRPGRLIAVWGPAGAPGRSTLAANLAYELAQRGRAALLVDVDTFGPSVAQLLGLVDEPPGIAAAARAANNGALDLPQLARTARQVAPRLRVLTGLNRTDRWPELRPTSLEAIWDLARGLAQLTIADCGFCVEQHGESGIDTAVPQRNSSTLTTLENADLIIAVGAGDPVGLQRLIRGLAELAELGLRAPVRVVVNRVRSAADGGDAAAVTELLSREAGISNVTIVPEDRTACDRAVLAGQFLAEAAPSSPTRVAIRALAASLIGEQLPNHRRSRRWRKLRVSA